MSNTIPDSNQTINRYLTPARIQLHYSLILNITSRGSNIFEKGAKNMSSSSSYKRKVGKRRRMEKQTKNHLQQATDDEAWILLTTLIIYKKKNHHQKELILQKIFYSDTNRYQIKIFWQHRVSKNEAKMAGTAQCGIREYARSVHEGYISQKRSLGYSNGSHC